MKISLAVLALLNLVKVNAINVQSVSQAAMMTEETRYIGSDGKPINLAQTTGHLKLDLTKVKKYSEPRPIDGMDVQLDSCSNPIHSTS
jgi:hypothetical protein